MTKHVLIQDQFSTFAPLMRQHFDSQFADVQSLSSKRFVWDFWHVPDQYTLLRTPAYHYFPEKLYMSFHKELVLWGRRNLGCWDISPPWLSNYVTGCEQKLHSDVPHGPWAFVFSLTPKKPRFTGGETCILKPQILNYWSQVDHAKDRELHGIMDFVAPKFNRLTVFDPRLPHGVNRVEGTMDPREGRLVVHGWFTEPQVYIEGALPKKQTSKVLNNVTLQISELAAGLEVMTGVVSLQIQVSKNGRVKSVKWATQNLLTIDGDHPTAFYKSVVKILSGMEFTSAASETLITLPLIFSN